MTATKHKRRSGNPAKPPKPRYRPGIWHRNHRFALFGIVGATALTLLVGFLGPSAVTLTLGPRHSYLPPWYLPAGVDQAQRVVRFDLDLGRDHSRRSRAVGRAAGDG